MKNLLSLLLVLGVFVTQGNCFAQVKKFRIFNALLYKNTPSLQEYGFEKIFLFYEDELLDMPGVVKDNSGRRINETKILKAARYSKKDSRVPVCLDIESWPLDGTYKQASREKYLKTLEIFRRTNKISRIGYFGVFPMDSPHADYSFNSKIRESVIMPKWNSTNNYFKNVGRAVDIYYPVFYTRYKDHETWVKIVKEKVSKIREINKNAVIYGFVWPQYYTNDGKFAFIEDDIWYKQLETLYKYCDGAVIWSHYKGADGKVAEFSTTMPWFVATKKFINKYNIK